MLGIWLPPAARAEEPSVGGVPLKVGVELEFFVQVKSGGLADEKGVPARLQLSDPSVADVSIIDARHLRILGKKLGTCDISVRGFDKKTHRYQVTVVSTEERAKEEFGRQRVDIGLGHIFVLPLPPGYYKKGGYPPLVSGSNHEIVDYDFLGSEVLLSARKEGIADITFLGGDGRHTLYRLWVKPHGEKVGAADKERLELKVGGSRDLELPTGFDPRRDKVILGMGGRVMVEATATGSLRLTGKAEGICDLAIVYRSKPTVYRIAVAPAPAE